MWRCGLVCILVVACSAVCKKASAVTLLVEAKSFADHGRGPEGRPNHERDLPRHEDEL